MAANFSFRSAVGRALSLTAIVGAAASAVEPPPAAPPDAEPMANVIVIAPEDLNAFWKKRSEPDFVWMTGAEFRRRLEAARASAKADPSPSGVVSQVIRGEVVDEQAHLAIDFRIAVTGEGPAWVPLRLDGQVVTRAREKDRELPLRQDEKSGWQVELQGAGSHEVGVELPVPVRSGADGRSIGLAIPEAASTRVEIDLGPGVRDATAGGRDVLAVEPSEGGRRNRIAAHLPSRPRLDLGWRLAAEPVAPLPPLLAVRGEIALEIDRGGVHSTSSWSIRSERGTTPALELSLAPEEELVELAIDGRPLPFEGRRDPALPTVSIAFPEPLKPGDARRLNLATRLPLPAGRWAYTGLAIGHASSQSGIVAISQGEDLWITGTAGHGLLQIDPRGELPDPLRRPSTVLAYRFLGQPFELGLKVDPSPPRVRVSSRTTVTVEPSSASVETWLDYRATRGRVFEARVDLPPRLTVLSAGPEDVVESWEVLGDRESGRELALRLRPRPRDEGGFRIQLSGREPLAAAPAPIGLFRPRGIDTGGKVAVVPMRDVSIELSDDGAGFVPTVAPAPADWPSPSDRAPPTLWLRHEGGAAALPVRVLIRPRCVQVETTVAAQVERRGLDVRQDSTCLVRRGALPYLDVAVPPALEGRWDCEGPELAGRSCQGPGPDGSTVVRLALRREVADSLRLRFRARLPIEPALGPERPRSIEVPRLRVLDGAEVSSRVVVATEPGIDLKPVGDGWSTPSADGPATPGTIPPRWIWTADGPGGSGQPVLLGSVPSPAVLPPLVASRLWLRTLQMPEGEQRTTAWYRLEDRPESMAVALPRGASWIGSRVNGEPVAAMERLPQSAGFRLRLPSGPSSGPVLVGLEYQIPKRQASMALEPPRLLEGGLVQESLWEVLVPWSRAAVGVPADWSEENDWSWDRYLWKRRPRMDALALANWVATPSVRPPVADVVDGTRGDYHGYLFGRPCDPEPMSLWIVPRAGLVAVCSGAVLGLGLLWLVGRRRGAWPWIAVPALAVAVLAAYQPAVALLAAQSSAAGVVLTLLAALTQRLVERRRPPSPTFLGPSGFSPSSPGPMAGAGLAPEAASAVGSDHSTVIRSRAPSTVDHAPAARADPVLERRD